MGLLGAIGRGIAKGAKAVGKGIAKAAQKIKEKITGKSEAAETPEAPEAPKQREEPDYGDEANDDWAEAVIDGFISTVDQTYIIYVDERKSQKGRAKNYRKKVLKAVDESVNKDKYTFAETLESKAGEIIRYFEQALYDSKQGEYYLNICLSMIREAATGKPTTVADSIQDTDAFYGEDI